MFNGKYVSYKEIIENVYRDFGFQYVFQTTDAIEWLGSALRSLKIPRYYVDKLTDGNTDLGHQDYITISDHRGKLPCDLYNITQTAFVFDCSDQGSNCGLTEDEVGCVSTLTGISYYDFDTGVACATGDGSSLCNSFVLVDPTKSCGCSSSDSDCGCSTCSSNITYIPMRWSTDTFYLGFHGCDIDYKCLSNLTYTVNNNYIFTNFKEGKVCMAYKAIPTDSEGYPLIPDNESVIQYIKWFIGERIAFKLMLTDKYSERKYEYFTSNLQLFFRKAKNEGKMLSTLDEFESYKNMRIKSIKNPNEHNAFFGNLQLPEIRYNHPRSNTGYQY